MPDRPRPAVLLVDDESAYTELIATTLAHVLDVPVYPFNRPQAALDALPQLEVGLIMTDFYMPQMNGLQFLRRALELKPGAPCLMITGHCTAAADAAEAGLPELKEVLPKPLAPTAVAAAIRRHWPLPLPHDGVAPA